MKPLPLSENAPTFEYDGMCFQFIATDDGSPSLRLSSAEQPAEAMHHCGGALAESLYIYGSLLTETMARGWRPPRVLSVGLGCGYNEWIALAVGLRAGVDQLYIESFEVNRLLRETFVNWLHEREPIADPASIKYRLQMLFSEVLTQVARHFAVDPGELRGHGQKYLQDRQWLMRERLALNTAFAQPFNTIFFDAFSTKSTPDLWSEEFLDRFLSTAAAPACGLSTYAATGRLNRALTRAGFELADFSGFAGKRQSTRAFRS